MIRPLPAVTAAVLLALTPFAAPVHAAAIPKAVAASVADSARPAADTQKDASRKPAETLAFAGVKPGDKVIELIPSAGYFTRLLSGVVGPKGHVYAMPPPPRPNAPADAPAPDAPVKAIAADPHYSNVTVVPLSMDLTSPDHVDLLWTSLNYHDLHNRADADVQAFDKKVFDALKPGGTYIVLDHAAEAGSGVRDTKTLHRIDPEAVKKEVESAGFTFVASSDVLKNADDPHTAPVFDPSIRGKTDQFI